MDYNPSPVSMTPDKALDDCKSNLSAITTQYTPALDNNLDSVQRALRDFLHQVKASIGGSTEHRQLFELSEKVLGACMN